MYCPNCGSLNDATAKFCFNCGAPLAKTETAHSGPVSVSRTRRRANTAIGSLVFWSCVMVVVGFFLPWGQYEGIISYNGWNISTLLMKQGGFTELNNQTLFS